MRPAHIRTAAAILVVAAIAVGVWLLPSSNLGDRDDAAPDPVIDTDEVLAEVESVVVNLISSGQGPRRSLTVDPGVPQSWEGQLTFALQLAPQTSARATGPSRLQVAPGTEPGVAVGAGDLGPLDVAVTLNGTTQAAEDAADFESSFEITADRTVSEVTSSASISPSAGLATEALGPIHPSLVWFLFPVPDQPVGVGAQWDLRGGLTLFGLEVDFAARVEVLELTAQRYRLALDLDLRGPEADGAESLSLTGTGQVVGVPDRLGPASATIALSGGGQSLSLEVTEGPAPAAPTAPAG